MGEITGLLDELCAGRHDAIRRLLPLVYAELHRLAASKRAHLPAPESSTTSLVHEAYLRLEAQQAIEGRSRAQFFELAARVMHSVLVDNARRRLALKRGGGEQRVALDEIDLFTTQRSEELLALDAALEALAAFDPRLHRVVVCRFFGGLEVEEAAEALETSPATVKRDWALARAWLHRHLSSTGSAP